MKYVYSLPRGRTTMTEPDSASELELLARELADEAVAVLAPETPPDLVSLIRVVIETDLLFDPRYADLMKAELFDRKHRDASGTVRKGSAETAARELAQRLSRRVAGK